MITNFTNITYELTDDEYNTLRALELVIKNFKLLE